ncbi:MAG: butyrate kinase [Armatimonadota bacterium]
MTLKIFIINPGSTSTKLAAYEYKEGLSPLCNLSTQHDKEEFKNCKSYQDEYPIRYKKITDLIKEKNIDLKEYSAIVSRGGPFKPLEGGTYIINDKLIEDIDSGNVLSPHISLLSAKFAYNLAKEHGIPAYFADPVSTDEYHDYSRPSGLSEIERISLWHALNCKAVAREAAKDTGKKLEDINFVIAHLGGGITVAALLGGRAVDSTNANSEGAMSPERAGTLPALELVNLCYSGRYDKQELIKKITKGGGLAAYLGTNDAKEIEEKAEKGDEKAKFYLETMAYQVSKEIGAYSAVLKGRVDAIILTGGLARSELVTDFIKERVSFIAPVKIYPGEDEMLALAQAGVRILNDEEKTKEYV